MATVSKWTPFGVALDVTATGGTVTRTSATQYTVKINVSWETYYSGAQTNYGMSATSGGVTKVISSFGTKRSSGSASFTGTYAISGNGSATKTVTVTFKNYAENYQGTVTDSASKNVSFSVTVPAWTSYTVKYNANGGSGAPSSQTKWKGQSLTLSSTKPTKSGYTFLGWSTSSSATSATYSAGGKYTTDAAVTLYAIWRKQLTLSYNANGGSSAPTATSAYVYNSTTSKTFTISSTKPTKSGYTFLGWSTSSSATSVTHAAGASITISANTTLYAVWIIAYVAPKITGYSVDRCDANGTIMDEGTYALISFDWSTFAETPSISVTWESVDGSITGSTTITVSGTSGTVSQTVGNGALTTDSSFDITVTVSDSGGATSKNAHLNSLEFPIEVAYENGKYGVGLGKTAELIGYVDVGYKTRHHDHIEFENNKVIYGTKPDGTKWEAFNPQNANGNTVVGYDNYENQNGLTNIYGYDLNFGVSNIANPGTYRPYRRQGDSMTISVRTAGYITNAKKDLSFWIPFSIPIIGSPTVTVTCVNGFQLRQGDKYICGSSASVYAVPTSIEASVTMYNGVYVKAVFSDTTNTVNNDTVGIYFNGTITFS